MSMVHIKLLPSYFTFHILDNVMAEWVRGSAVLSLVLRRVWKTNPVTILCVSRLLKMRTDKSKFISSSLSARPMFQNVLDEMLKCAPKDTATGIATIAIWPEGGGEGRGGGGGGGGGGEGRGGEAGTFFKNFAKGTFAYLWGDKSALKFLHIDVPRLHLVHSKQNTGILVSLDSILAYRGA